MIKQWSKPWLSLYPVLVMVAVPALLVINTLWNLRAFNRDANFILRHQAVSIADSIKPVMQSLVTKPDELRVLLENLVAANEDIVKAQVYTQYEGSLQLVASSIEGDAALPETELSQLSVSYGEPFAGLVYDPSVKKDVWEVVSPLETTGGANTVMVLRMDTQSVTAILGRTVRDSLLILAGLVVAVILILVNHFYFYRKAVRTQQLEEVDRLKDEFIGMAAHELRTPMVAMLGYYDLIRTKMTEAERQKLGDDFNVLTSLTRELSDLINDLLDVSRIEQGRMTVQMTEVDLNQVISKVIFTLQPTAQAKKLQLVYTPTAVPPIKSDGERLRQILTNIVGNSLKYTLKGWVAVTVTIDQGQVQVEVRDTGIGIPAEEMPKLFTKFHRVGDSQTSEVRGTGLGLWITKQMVELIGGSIAVESIYGTGTRMVVRLPVSK